MNIELYTSFINEQKAFFDEYISPTFKNSWHDPTWQGGKLSLKSKHVFFSELV